MRKGYGDYPQGWKEYAARLKEEAGWKCVRCAHPHDPPTGYTLTVHHLTMNKSEPFGNWWAFAPLCQRCHLHIQAKVVMERVWMFDHSEWFKPYVAGYYAYHAGLPHDRESVTARMNEYLRLALPTNYQPPRLVTYGEIATLTGKQT